MSISAQSEHAAVVRITFDLVSRQWLASAEGDLSLSVRAHAYQQARRRIRRSVERQRGRDVRIEERLELPLPLARDLRTYQRRHGLWNKLTAYVRSSRLQLAYRLLDLQMSQSDVALLMGMSPAQLSALLERDAACEPSLRSVLAAE